MSTKTVKFEELVDVSHLKETICKWSDEFGKMLDKATPDEIAEILEEALSCLEATGWVRGKGFGPNGEHCTVTAITKGAEQINRLPLQGVAVRAIGHTLGVTYGEGVINWNDKRGRRYEEVHDAFVDTIKAIRNGDVDPIDNYRSNR